MAQWANTITTPSERQTGRPTTKGLADNDDEDAGAGIGSAAADDDDAEGAMTSGWLVWTVLLPLLTDLAYYMSMMTNSRHVFHCGFITFSITIENAVNTCLAKYVTHQRSDLRPHIYLLWAIGIIEI